LHWELLTRLGWGGTTLVAAAAVLWCLELRRRLKNDPSDVALLRRAAAAAALAAGVSLLATPFHFASGLSATLMAALAIAPLDFSARHAAVSGAQPRHGGIDPASQTSLIAGNVLRAIVAIACLLSVAPLISQQRAVGRIDQPFADAAAYQNRMETLRDTIPGHPLLERKILDVRLLQATEPQERAALMEETLTETSPAYVRDFGPNLVQFAQLGMGSVDESATILAAPAAALLQRAGTLMHATPALVAERLHLALLKGEKQELDVLISDFQPLSALYPLGQDYLTAAQ
jgi:hypothetical protein